MTVAHGLGEKRIKNSAVTIGKFDGVHRGHGLLLDMLSKEQKLRRIVFTFEPFEGSPISSDNRLCNDEEKVSLLSAYSPDLILFYPFGRKQASMSPKRFVKTILLKKLGMKKLFVGPDFTFGKNGRGNVSLLRKMAEKYDFELIVPDKVEFEGEAISSTRIKKALEEGQREEAENMLGHRL